MSVSFYGYTDTLKGVYYGPGSLASSLPKLLDTIGGTKALVVTGKTLHDKTDVVKKVEAVLKDKDAFGAIFFEIGEHSPIAGIRKGLQVFKENKCDIIVSVGGGSPIDASKAILYHLQLETNRPTLRQIAIPTTLSAAEYTIGAGFTDDSGNKVGVASQELAPAGVILDAELTLATPERLWLSSGMRAVDHAVENLYRPPNPWPIKILAYAALAELFKYLPESKANPQSVDIRQKLQVAAWMSLWPLKLEKWSPHGLSHALGHKLGARYGIPHGITSCLTLAPVVALKSKVASKEDKDFLAQALFYLREQSTGSVEGDVMRLSSLIEGLVKDLGLQTTLTAYNVPEEDIPKIAEGAMGGRDDPTFPMVVDLLKGMQ